jgi:hypothetical protein
MSALLIPFLVYVIVTFAIAFAWHLKIFEARYKALEIYRDDMKPLFGLGSMAIQGVCFAMVYSALFASIEAWFSRALAYAVFGALFSWSFSTLAVSAKNKMRSIRDYVAIETAFTALQWVVVAAITAALV